MTKVTVASGGKSPLTRGLPITLEVTKDVDAATVADVKAALAAKFPRLYVERQKLTLKGDRKALKDEATLASVGVHDGDELAVKDLGAQIGWRNVYLIEYVGPLVVHPLIYNFPEVFYGKAIEHSQLQQIAYAMVMVHFLKRELETLFVHRFSHGTMPIFNVFKNSAHYHILGGLFLAYPIYSSTYSATSPYVKGTIRENPQFLWACSAFWLFCELVNLNAHITLRNLRPPGTRTRAIPYGFGFSLVSSPHYLFDLLAWVTLASMSGSWAAWLFFVVSATQMVIWASKKHRAYKKEFGKDYPRGRKALVPFIF
ncbi:hypothetical protein FA95DRAFT_1553882 [Auriscalpium vulgare]|uniref:Uncharacterized protein n=1 Tax=Auriscalpium vulgare TaxID=40419 RepID=A0ACB8S8D1_9AGAM|nr:hypothetical protein FA95DRAFT_1553882 [Auriscalpium vulgare]